MRDSAPGADTWRCPLCGAPVTADREVRDWEQGRPLWLATCATCGVGAIHPALDDDTLATYYPAPFYGAEGGLGSVVQRAFLRERALLVARSGIRSGKLLDVGCGDGAFLAHMRGRGFTVAGVEPSQAGRERALARGLRVVGEVGVVEDGPYDVITLWHVLEHVRRADAALRDLRSRIASHGRLIVAVPHAESFEARCFGDAWFHLDPPRHQLQFTPSSLRALLRRSGFATTTTRHLSLEYDPFGLVQSLWNTLGPSAHNGLYRVLKRGERLDSLSLGERFSVGAGLLTLPASAAAAVTASVVFCALRRTGTFAVIARPA